MKFDYVIYHKNCFDGFTGLILFMHTDKFVPGKIIIMPDMPSAKDVPVGIENKSVLIIDVAYKPDILATISKKSKVMWYIDHHITHYDKIMKLDLKPNDKIIYDQHRCGASLVWKTFYKEKMPLCVRYIEDNDTGTWKLKHTLEFIAGLEVHYTTEPSADNIEKWMELFDKKKVIELIRKGRIYDEYKKYLINSNAKRYSMEGFPSKKIYNEFPNKFQGIGQYRVAVYNGNGCPNVSLLGKKMVDTLDCDFALLWTYNLDRKEYIISLRSRKIDVSNIANIFGGGGHELAAAFSFNRNKYMISDLFMENSLPRQYI